jgi:hypothetical protein
MKIRLKEATKINSDVKKKLQLKFKPLDGEFVRCST